MNIQWYPGHMTKAMRAMKEDIKLIDLVIELLDARLPLSSRNPDIDTLGQNKSRLILLNKADLADEKANNKWQVYFENKGYYTVMLDSRKPNEAKKIQNVVMKACKAKIERDRKRGILNRPVRAMVVGIPNVGKSTFINSYAGKSCAKTGNRPGVTKGKQWIKLSKTLELLDTPGVLWPKFEDEKVGMNLAIAGSINDSILNETDLAFAFIGFLKSNYPDTLSERYEADTSLSEHEILADIAKNRKCLLKGGDLDLSRAAMILLDDFRNGRLGRITLELPDGE